MKSILKAENLDLNLQKINDLVILCNEIVKLTYQLIRLYALDRFEKGEPLPNLDDTEILNFMRCLGESEKRRSPKPETKEKMEEYNNFYENTFKQLINKPKFNFKNMTQILLYLAKKMETSYKNNIREHFNTRIRRYMNIFDPDPIKPNDTPEQKSIKKNIFTRVKNCIIQDKIDEIPEDYKDWAKDIKNKYLPVNYSEGKGLAYNIKAQPLNKYLECTIKMNKSIEDRNEMIKKSNISLEEKRKATKKLFQPISLRTSNVPCYITLDSQILLKHFGLKGDSYKIHEKGATEKYNDYIWSLIFDTNKKPLKPSKSLLENGYKVSSIETDGVGVSIIFQKKATGSKKVEESELTEPKYIDEATLEEKQEIKRRKIVSVDPGKANMVYLSDGEKKLRLTNSQRRHETRSIYDSRKILKKREDSNIIGPETELSKFNGKTANLDEYKEYIKKKVEVDEIIMKLYQDLYFRKLKWRRCINTRRSEDKFLNNIKKIFGEDPLLAYGDFSSGNHHMKGVYPSMGNGLRSKIWKWYDIFMVNEYMTSQLCCKCEKKLVNFRDKNNEKVHRLLVCPDCITSGSESKKTSYINRDMNACINIIKVAKSILETGERPLNFRRKKVETVKKKYRFKKKKTNPPSGLSGI